MGGPEKPFACSESGCGETFTNEDRLSVHARKHDMELQLGNKGGQYVADQTPTPTRFIRNCEEVGLFQDLQNVNPFDETFKRAMEARTGSNHLTLDGLTTISDDALHTPHIFPHLAEDNPLYSTTAELRSTLTVSRLSSDEGSNQLSVVKCTSSCVEENLSSVGVPENEKDNTTEIKIQKIIDIDKTKKLMRQEPVDIADNLDTRNLHVQSGSFVLDVRKITTVKEIIIVNDKNSPENNVRMLKIPIISISETTKTDKKDDNDDVIEDSIKNELTSEKLPHTQQTVLKKDYLLSTKDVELDLNTMKSNMTKLMSQKSIDMALINFTNEAQSKTMDLQNISIEDLPAHVTMEGLTDEDNTEVAEEPILENESSRHILKRHMFKLSGRRERRKKSANEGYFSNSESQDKEFNSNKQSLHSVNKQTDIKRRKSIDNQYISSNSFGADNIVIPTIKSVGGKAFPDTTDKGYELMLKWPGGKKVYLKEVFREDDEKQKETYDSEHTPNTASIISAPLASPIIISDSNVSVVSPDTINVKQKLKDTIQNNAIKKRENKIVLNPIQHKLPIPALHPPQKKKILQDNYIIYPPITPRIVNSTPIFPSNIQYVPVVTPQTSPVQTYLISSNGEVCQPQAVTNYTELLSTQNISHANSIVINNSPKEFIPSSPTLKLIKNIHRSKMVINDRIPTDTQSEEVTEHYSLNKSDRQYHSAEHSHESIGVPSKVTVSTRTVSNKRSVEIKLTPIARKIAISVPGDSNKNKTLNADKVVNIDMKERNKAAVSRYRSKKQAEIKLVQEKNDSLEKANELLRTQLANALQEIKQLHKILRLHTNCSINQTPSTGSFQIVNMQQGNMHIPQVNIRAEDEVNRETNSITNQDITMTELQPRHIPDS